MTDKLEQIQNDQLQIKQFNQQLANQNQSPLLQKPAQSSEKKQDKEQISAFDNDNQKNLKQYLSELEIGKEADEFYGINKKLYKKPEKNIKNMQDPPFKTITDYTFLPCNPEFTNLAQAYETVNIPKQNILEESLRKQVQSIMFAETFINQIVYDSKDPSPFTKHIDPGSINLDMLPYYIPKSKEDSILVFQSRFQSGNLRRSVQITQFEYNLMLSTDYQTNAHTQWYYFSVANTRKDVQYRFKILNMMKPDSLYNVGMKPLVYSEKLMKLKNIGWHREGIDICYYNTNLKRKNGAFYNALAFSLKFQYDYDTVYIAHCYPYTYTQLQRYLRALENDPVKRTKFQRKTLCQTEAGNNCDYITIGQNNNTGKQKKAIFLTSRVHPGQTMVSYLIQYIIDFLISNNPVAKTLRDNFVFKIIPMLNIDGVINGNYRCNLSGADLNRQWIDPSRKLHPTIYYAKNLIKKTKQERQLLIYCDFHGHSRKKNIFIYGCTGKDSLHKEQVFPILMKNNCSVFSFKDCCFSIQKDREGAARIALWRQLNIINCFTLQLSFCGSDFGKYEYYHFNTKIYKEIAIAFCQSILDHYEPDQNKYRQALEQVQQILKNMKYEEKRNDSDDSDYSCDDVKQTANLNNLIANQIGKQRQQKKSLQGRQNQGSSMPQQNETNKVIIKKKAPLNIPSKKKK